MNFVARQEFLPGKHINLQSCQYQGMNRYEIKTDTCLNSGSNEK